MAVSLESPNISLLSFFVIRYDNLRILFEKIGKYFITREY